MEFIFKCANERISGILERNDFRNVLQLAAFSVSSDSSESYRSNCLLKLSIVCHLKTLDNSFTKISLNNFVSF